MRRARSESATGVRPGRRSAPALAIAIVIVATIVAAVHAPVLRSNALCFDDGTFVTGNPLVATPSWRSVARFFGEVLEPSTVRGYYLPLSMTSLMLDVAAGGRPDELFAFHRTSLLLHALQAVLIVLLLFRLFGALLPAAIAGLLFGLHPLTVEPIAWIGERKTLLAAVLATGAILAYVEAVRRESRGWRWGSVTLYACALLAKPTVVMLPLVLVLLDAWPLRRWSRRAGLEKWPFFLLSSVSAVVTLISHQRTAGVDPTTASDLAHWPLHSGYLLGFYLGKVFWPAELSCVYPPPHPFAPENAQVAVPVAVAVITTVVAAWALRRTAAPLIGWLIFVIALAPTLGLVKYSWVVAADKYLYFPALGLLLPVAAGLGGLLRRRPPGGSAPRVVVLAIVAILLIAEARGVRATLRNWSDSQTLFRHMERLAPQSPGVNNQLGVLLARIEPARARAHLERAIAAVPQFGEAHYNLGLVLAGEHRIDEAIPRFARAVELMPRDPDAAYNLGLALMLARRPLEAEAPLRRALETRPDHVDALDQLGGALAAQGRVREAAERFRASLRIRPDGPQALNALAWLLATAPDSTLRNPAEALVLARRASAATGNGDPNVLDTRAAAEAATGRFEDAVVTARRAAEIAEARGATALATEVRDRMRRYARGEPYVDDPGTSSP